MWMSLSRLALANILYKESFEEYSKHKTSLSCASILNCSFISTVSWIRIFPNNTSKVIQVKPY